MSPHIILITSQPAFVVASSLKQQSAGRHVSPHIILITSQPVFVVASSLKQQSAGRHVSPHIINQER
jgi:hypothetical protein